MKKDFRTNIREILKNSNGNVESTEKKLLWICQINFGKLLKPQNIHQIN